MKPTSKALCAGSKKPGFVLVVSTLLLLCSFACATRAPHEDAQATEKPDGMQVQDQTQTQVAKLQDKIQDLETRLNALNDKINLENGGKPATGNPGAEKSEAAENEIDKAAVKDASTKPVSQLPKKAVVLPAAHAQGVPNFVQDEAVDRYREAKILFDSKRYSDSIVEFANFVKNNPDHTLAAGAQFYVGMGYFQQGEFKLAEEEFNRGLIAYPHSEFVPDTLLALATTSFKLKKTTRVTYYKQKLLSSFPNSPQAKGITLAANETAVEPSESSRADSATHESATESENRKENAAPVAPSAPVAPTSPSAPSSDSHSEDRE